MYVCKYVDDTSALEIIPRNSPSLLNVVPLHIHNFAIAHNMRLNPTKCKEMHINFLRNSNCLINPIIIGGNVIKSVNTYKVLGVISEFTKPRRQRQRQWQRERHQTIGLMS